MGKLPVNELVLALGSGIHTTYWNIENSQRVSWLAFRSLQILVDVNGISSGVPLDLAAPE